MFALLALSACESFCQTDRDRKIYHDEKNNGSEASYFVRIYLLMAAGHYPLFLYK